MSAIINLDLVDNTYRAEISFDGGEFGYLTDAGTLEVFNYRMAERFAELEGYPYSIVNNLPATCDCGFTFAIFPGTCGNCGSSDNPWNI